VVQLISDAYQSTDLDLVASESALLGRIATELGRPLSFTVQQVDEAPNRYRDLLDAIEQWNFQGAHARAQVAVRPIGVLIGMTASANPLNFCRSFRPLRNRPLAEKVAFVRNPENRARLIEEHASQERTGFHKIVHGGYSRMYPLTDPPNYEPTPRDSVAGLAAAAGRDPRELLFDLLIEDEGRRLFYIPLMNYAAGNLDAVRDMLVSPNAILGLSDAGAHCNSISDGTFPTTALTHWTRDRTRGETLPLEMMVHHQTQRTAAHVGWLDRGVIAPGYLADLNVIDMNRLALRPPHIAADLPAGGTRLLQHAVGYVATIKRGEVTVTEGSPTDERPGRLIRGTTRPPVLPVTR
jgi:N-acyl-D-aspartate/D-glutamate deacylase